MTVAGRITNSRGEIPRGALSRERTTALLPSLVMLCAVASPIALPAAEAPAAEAPAAAAPAAAAEASPRAQTAATAKALFIEAQAATAAGRLDEAQGLLHQAALQAPENQEIQAEIAKLKGMATGVPTAQAIPSAVLAQWANAEIVQARNRADLMVRAGRFEDAAEQLTVVRHNLIARRLNHDATVADGIAQLDKDLLHVNEQRSVALTAQDQTQRSAILDRARDRSAAEQQNSVSLLQERIRRVTELREHGHLELALAEIRTLLVHDGDNAQVRELYRDVLADAHKQRRLTTEQEAAALAQEVNEQINRSLMPEGFDGLPIYPDGWRTKPRGAADRTAVAEPAWKDSLRDSLRSRISVDADSQNGIDVLTTLAAANRLNLVIDPALTAGPELTITMHAPSISLENAITWLCRQMGTSWSLTRGAVWIGTPIEDTESPLSVYDIAVLTAGSLDQPGKVLALSSGAGAVGGGAGFENAATGTPPPTPDEVVDLIKASIAPEVWNKDGNGITVRGTQLYITAPVSIHRLITEFVRSQEQAHNLLVKVDARWLTLDDNFLEEIGVDWAVTPSSLLTLPGFASGVTRETPNSTLVGAVSNVMPASAVQRSTQGAATQGLTIGWSYLGTVQLSAVIRATESNLRSRILSAPMLTTINGVQSSLFMGNQTAYVSDYEVVSSNLDPTISVLNTGVVLDIRPQISADRKYITMDFQPAVTSVTFFTETIFAPRVFVAGGGNVGDTGNNGTITAATGYPLELPNIIVREAGTTLTIPDRGSALIGGFTGAIDQQTESRVPFIGDIPFLGRLFGRRGRYSEHEKLYLLATLTIISYDEQEAKL